jgi:hypothetical protein
MVVPLSVLHSAEPFCNASRSAWSRQWRLIAQCVQTQRRGDSSLRANACCFSNGFQWSDDRVPDRTNKSLATVVDNASAPGRSIDALRVRVPCGNRAHDESCNDPRRMPEEGAIAAVRLGSV